jgi:hypothetical protein
MDGSVAYQKLRQAISSNGLSSLRQAEEMLGSLPQEALLLGIAGDGLPVLLNLSDPKPGPILVAGDSYAGKTDLLQTISRFAVITHDACEIQYGVITNHPEQWDNYAAYDHCVGIFPAANRDVTDFIRALVAWAKLGQNSRQSVLLLIDGLDDFLFWNGGLANDLQTLLSCGPAKRIWPFITVNMEDLRYAEPWLRRFSTQIFGYTRHANAMDHGCPQAGLAGLLRGAEFYLKEKEQWIKFRIPRALM